MPEIWSGPKGNKHKMQTLTAHLEELRRRILITGAFFLVLCLFGIFFSTYIFQFLLELQPGYEFIYETPAQLVMQYIKIGMWTGFILTLPVIFYELAQFLFPGLKRNERRIILLLLTFGVLFFALGILFSYKIMIPFALEYFLRANSHSQISPTITIASYVDFLTTFFLVFGVLFELPVILSVFTSMGLVRARWLLKGQRYIILTIFILAAFITPPNATSQIIVAVPIVLLFELSMGICYLIERIKGNRQLGRSLQ